MEKANTSITDALSLSKQYIVFVSLVSAYSESTSLGQLVDLNKIIMIQVIIIFSTKA